MPGCEARVWFRHVNPGHTTHLHVCVWGEGVCGDGVSGRQRTAHFHAGWGASRKRTLTNSVMPGGVSRGGGAEAPIGGGGPVAPMFTTRVKGKVVPRSV